MIGITEDELLRALEEAQQQAPAGDPGLTMADLMAVTGRSKYALSNQLRKLAADGSLIVGRRQTKNIAGISRYDPTYRVKPV